MGIRQSGKHWHYRFTLQGHEYTGSTKLAATEQNRGKAEAKEARARLLVETGQGDTLKIRQRRFTDAVEDWLAWAKGEYQAHPNTYSRLKGSAASLMDFFGVASVSTITAGRIEGYKTWRRACPHCHGEKCDKCGQTGRWVQEVTIRHDLHALSGFFRYARKQRWLVGNPLEDVDIPSDKDAVRIHPLTAAEEQAYFAAAQARKLWDLHDLGRLMIQQGCRPEEFFELQWSNVDLEAGTMRVVDGKSDAAKRTLRLTAESREVLARRWQAQERRRSSWVFPSPRKPGAHMVMPQRQHEAILKATGLSFVPYDWRHTFGTRKALAGMPLPTLAAIMGHANLRSIMKYVHVQPEDTAAAMAKFDEPVTVEQVSPLGAPGRVQ